MERSELVSDTGLAERVERIEAHLAIEQLAIRYAMAVDARDMEAWVGCIAGALAEGEYRRLLAEAGFGEVGIEVTRVYDYQDLAERVSAEPEELAAALSASGRIVSAFVRARKPA